MLPQESKDFEVGVDHDAGCVEHSWSMFNTFVILNKVFYVVRCGHHSVVAAFLWRKALCDNTFASRNDGSYLILLFFESNSSFRRARADL